MPTPVIVSGEVAIARSPQEIFDVLADPTAWFTIDEALVDVQPRERLVPGVSGTMRRRVGPGLKVTTAWENTALRPGVRIEMLITGFGYELHESVVLSGDPAGTRVTVVDALSPTSLIGRVMVAASRRIVQRDLDTRFAKLKSMLESRPATSV
jgi:hypothetical protein